MHVINIHKRYIQQPKERISAILNSLSSREDRLWPHEKWAPVILDNGLARGSTGGHGPVCYHVTQYVPGSAVEFGFIKPAGYHGMHRFDVMEVSADTIELRHTIDM